LQIQHVKTKHEILKFTCQNYYTYMTFNELNINPPLLKALSDLGFTQPTRIQEQVFNVVMSGKDMFGISQTGTGKTLAYLLPCIRQWKFSGNGFPQVIIVVPTRELVVQVVEEVKKLSTYLSLVAVGVYGGVNIRTQMETISAGVDVLVATPGRLLDLALTRVLRFMHVKRLVIDEVDEMLNLGFRAQLTRILDLLPPKRQNLMFSATMTEDIEQLIRTFFKNTQKIEAAPTGTPLENIIQIGYQVPNFYTKINLLKLLLSNEAEMKKVLVFVSHKKLADEVYDLIESKFPNQLGVIHSNKAQNNRFNTVKQFHKGENRILIATDIISRGLDISEISHVINFDTPEVPEQYMHRIGRTGRADKNGISITFLLKKDAENQTKIESLMNQPIPIVPLPENLEISEILTEDEKPQIKMKDYLGNSTKILATGSAFQEKIVKNKKINGKIHLALKLKQKHGKPKTRGLKHKG